MSLNATILELSQQIAYLQSQYDVLAAENQNLKSEVATKVNRNARNQNSKKIDIHFLKSVQALREKRVSELEEKYKEELSFIRKRYPRWEPKV